MRILGASIMLCLGNSTKHQPNIIQSCSYCRAVDSTCAEPTGACSSRESRTTNGWACTSSIGTRGQGHIDKARRRPPAGTVGAMFQSPQVSQAKAVSTLYACPVRGATARLDYAWVVCRVFGLPEGLRHICRSCIAPVVASMLCLPIARLK